MVPWRRDLHRITGEPGQGDVSGQPFLSMASGALCDNPVQSLQLDLARVLGRAGRSAEAVAAYCALPAAVMEGDPMAWMGYASSLVAVGDAHGAESALAAALLQSSPSPQACPGAHTCQPPGHHCSDDYMQKASSAPANARCHTIHILL